MTFFEFQIKNEGGTDPHFAFNIDRTTLKFDQLFYDREAKPGATIFSGGIVGGLCKDLKNTSELILRDTYSGVADGETEFNCFFFRTEQINTDLDTTFFGEFDCISN